MAADGDRCSFNGCTDVAVIKLESICRREHHGFSPACARHEAMGRRVPVMFCVACQRAGEGGVPLDMRWVPLGTDRGRS